MSSRADPIYLNAKPLAKKIMPLY